MNIHKNIIVLLFVCLSFNTFSQTEINVLTKKIEKTFNTSIDGKIEISAIKANIKLKCWNKDETKVIALLVAKNKDVKNAKREIEYINCYIESKGDKIEIKNIFIIPQAVKEVNSILYVEYELTVPLKSKIIINNKYGSINMEAMHLNSTIDIEYGEIVLKSLTGSLKVNSKLTKIKGSDLNGIFTFKSENTEFDLQNIGGTIDINNSIGKINLESDITLKSLTINSLYSEITCKTKEILKYNCYLISKYGEIQVPVKIFKNENIRKNLKNEFEYMIGSKNPKIYISTSFSKIKLEEE